MFRKFSQAFRLIYGLLLSVLLIISAILLITACIDIYNIGPSPFDQYSIANAFSKIRVPIFITLAAIVLGAIMQLALPKEEKKHRASPDKRASIKRLEERIDTQNISPYLSLKLTRSRRLEKTILIGAISLSLIALAISSFFALNPAMYGEDYNGSIIYICSMLLPWVIFCFAVWVAYYYIVDAILVARIEVLKQAVASGNAIRPSSPSEKDSCKCRKNAILSARIIILVIALALLVLGIFGKGMLDVLTKAINICTECIGLG